MACQLCGHARMDDDPLLQFTGLDEYPTEDVVNRRRRKKSPAMYRENWRREPWMERTRREPWLEKTGGGREKERDLVRDWGGKEGKTMNAGGVGELE
ncbi:hypothetical protein TNCV_2357191 [Trichonephila clavipes]|nr:hypothetical protein TNCV_2357191 [Trichonephila clavipes]